VLHRQAAALKDPNAPFAILPAHRQHLKPEAGLRIMMDFS
jgi:hypothetical protein